MKGVRLALGLALALALALATTAAQGHRASDGFLELAVEGGVVRGHYEIALRDAVLLADFDVDRDRTLTWGELSRGGAALRDALAPSLAIEADGRPCAARLGEVHVNARSDGPYAWYALEADCGRAPLRLHVSYRVLFDVDPSHRGLLTVRARAATHTAVFEPARDAVALDLAAPSALRQATAYFREGAHHIWIGVDHVLFLLALLLPCVLRRSRGAWRPSGSLRETGWEVFRVVTAFTLAHSVTLSLSALDLLRLPAGPTEMAIALSVLLAALNNVYPVVTGARWQVAFGFGLIHGFGFASVLGDMDLPAGTRALALLAFNAGIEAGQLAIVAVLLPVAFALRERSGYPRAMQAGSLAMAAVAVAWLAERGGLLAA